MTKVFRHPNSNHKSQSCQNHQFIDFSPLVYEYAYFIYDCVEKNILLTVFISHYLHRTFILVKTTQEFVVSITFSNIWIVYSVLLFVLSKRPKQQISLLLAKQTIRISLSQSVCLMFMLRCTNKCIYSISAANHFCHSNLFIWMETKTLYLHADLRTLNQCEGMSEYGNFTSFWVTVCSHVHLHLWPVYTLYSVYCIVSFAYISIYCVIVNFLRIAHVTGLSRQ